MYSIKGETFNACSQSSFGLYLSLLVLTFVMCNIALKRFNIREKGLFFGGGKSGIAAQHHPKERWCWCQFP